MFKIAQTSSLRVLKRNFKSVTISRKEACTCDGIKSQNIFTITDPIFLLNNENWMRLGNTEQKSII